MDPSEQPALPPESTLHLQREYWCFISYRHADNKEPGRQWATWLHQALETYEVPADLVGRKNERGDLIPDRIFPVFRDEVELPADAELSKPIEAALQRSRFLVVLCSPQAVQSPYVSAEILRFKQLGKHGRILAAIIEGSPNASYDPAEDVRAKECFPHPLRYTVDAQGQITSERTEPIAPDFRLPDGTPGWTSPAAYRQSLEAKGLPARQIKERVEAYAEKTHLMLLKIIAGVLGVPLGVLTQRDKAYQLAKAKKRARILYSVASGFAVLMALAIFGGVVAWQQKQKADANATLAQANEQEAKKQKSQAVTNATLAQANEKEALINQKRAEKGEAEAEKNLIHANSLLFQASYSAWNEAERSRLVGRPQDALAYIAKGMENAPGNTGLLAFAYTLMGSDGLPWRTFAMDYPVANAFFDETGNHLVIAEVVFDTATRYSLWELQTMLKKDSCDLPVGSPISEEHKVAKPWLKAVVEQGTDSDEEKWIAPGGFQELLHGGMHPDESEKKERRELYPELGVGDLRVVAIDELGGYGGDVPDSELSPDRCFSGAKWSQNGTRIATIHGIRGGTEIEKGKVLVWDLRHADGLSFLPGKPGIADGNKSDHISEKGNYVHRSIEEGSEIAIIGQPNGLWKVERPEGYATEVLLDPEREKVLVWHYGTADFRFEWRAIKNGELLTSKAIVAPAGWEHESPTEIALHPSSSAVAIINQSTLIAWTSPDSSPQVMNVPGPKDEFGWANAITFTPDGKGVLLGTGRRMVFLKWPGLALTKYPPYHESMVSHIAVSADGKLAITSSGFNDGAGSSGYAQLWQMPDLLPVGPRFGHANQMSGVGFLEDGNLLYTASESPEGSDFRLWEAKTLLPLTTYLSNPSQTGQAFIRFDSFTPGEIAEVGMAGEIDAFSNENFQMKIPRAKEDTPAWFYQHFLPFVSARRVAPEGAIEGLSPDEMRSNYQKLLPLLTEHQVGIHYAILKWYFSNFSKRPIDPWSKVTLDSYLETTVFAPTRAGQQENGLGHAYRLDPSHPLLHLHIALGVEDDPVLKKRLIKYGQQLLESESNSETYGRERWQEQLITGKKIIEKLK